MKTWNNGIVEKNTSCELRVTCSKKKRWLLDVEKRMGRRDLISSVLINYVNKLQ